MSLSCYMSYFFERGKFNEKDDIFNHFKKNIKKKNRYFQQNLEKKTSKTFSNFIDSSEK